MQVTYFPNYLTKHKCVLVLGAFESIHQGHMALLNVAKKTRSKVAVMVLENPSDIPGAYDKRYASLDVRLQILANLKVDYAIVVKLDNVTKALPGEEFIKKIIASVNAKALVMGKDFACGLGRNYQATDIARDYPATIVPLVKINNQKISTSLLKEAAETGDIDLINKLAVAPFMLDTKIDHNFRFKFNDYVKLHTGVYAATIIVNHIEYPATVHVGLDYNQITIPFLKVKNQSFLGKIIFHKLIKTIYSKKNDLLTTRDSELAHRYLLNLK